MAKMASIQAELEKASGRKPSPAPVSAPVSVAAPANSSTGYKAPSREGRVHIGAYLPPDFKRSLMLVRAQTGQDVQTLVAQALNDLFRAHNVPVIDQT
jgi:hypothetical protein